MEYAADFKTKGEYKDLKAGIYEVRSGKLFLIEDLNDGGKSAVDAAADRFEAALSKLLQ
jgi:hypothetical protein